MKNIYSNIYKNSLKNLNIAIKILKKNNIIVVPTETVYGIAGNAYSQSAVKKIYKLKNRPKKNPLIIHYRDISSVKKDAKINDRFKKLYKKFSPGPITFILEKKKKSKICKLANAKLNTIAVRFPKHNSIRNLLKKIDFPLAIPSANIAGKISPVSPDDVIDEFGKKISFILDGGRSQVGLESTVVNLFGKTKILRPGAITKKHLKEVLRERLTTFKGSKKIRSPGLLKKHYSPGIPIKLNSKKGNNKVAFITFGKKYKNGKNIFNLSSKGNLNEAGKNLYKILRKIINSQFKSINVAKIPNKGIGVAINDRLRRAAK